MPNSQDSDEVASQERDTGGTDGEEQTAVAKDVCVTSPSDRPEAFVRTKAVDEGPAAEPAVQLYRNEDLLDLYNQIGLHLSQSGYEIDACIEFGDRLAGTAKVVDGHADELAMRRPHPDEHLYDIEDGLRFRAEEIETFLQEEYFR